MRYQYNFGFLDEWTKANPQIKTVILLKAFGVKAKSGVEKWLEGKHPIPVISMLRFCNTFNVPLSAFFRDLDAGEGAAVIPGLPSSTDVLEPVGGYCKTRERGEHTLFDPLDISVTPSVVPGIADNEKYNEDESNVTDKSTDMQAQQILDNNDYVQINDIFELELKHKEQINRLLDIISEQQKQINKLYSKIEVQTLR